MEHFIQGNVQLRYYLLIEETLFMSWRWFAIKDVNDCALSILCTCSNWIFVEDIQDGLIFKVRPFLDGDEIDSLLGGHVLMRFCIAPLLVVADDEVLVEVWIGEQLEVVSETSVEVDIGESILAASMGTEP